MNMKTVLIVGAVALGLFLLIGHPAFNGSFGMPMYGGYNQE
jgi:hypothetical protein